MRSHAWIDARSLALHEAIAARLEADPRLIAKASANLRRWLSTRAEPAWLEWQRVLDTAAVPDLLVLLRSSDDYAAWLRQSSPFAGVLTREERQAIFAQYDSRRA